LEHHRLIRQAERHDQELKEPLVRAERRLVDILGRHEHLMIPETKVELGEVLGTA
jgi:hypothetical protein